MTSQNHGLRAILNTLFLGVLFALIWSLSFVVTKTALLTISPIGLASIRLLLAGLVLVVFRFGKVARFWRDASQSALIRIIGAGLLSQGIYLTASYWALLKMPTSVVNIVVSSLPLVTLPFAFVLLGEKIRFSSVIAFVLSISGVGVTLMSGQNISMVGFASYGIPAAVLFLSVLALALGNVIVKPLVNSADLAPICATHFLSAGLAALLLSTMIEPIVEFRTLYQAGAYILFLSLIGSILGTLVWFRLLDRMPAGAASSFFLLTPIFGILFGWLFFAEQVTSMRIIGVLIISSAILLKSGAMITEALTNFVVREVWRRPSRKSGAGKG